MENGTFVKKWCIKDKQKYGRVNQITDGQNNGKQIV